MAPSSVLLDALSRRQDNGLGPGEFGPPDDSVDYALRYGVVGGIVVFILAWVILGMVHANYRVRHGKEPLFYHRCLLPPRSVARMQSRTTYFNAGGASYYPRNRAGNEYMMQEWQQHFPAPPPIYSPTDAPPKYAVPTGPPPGREQQPGSSQDQAKNGATITAVAVHGEPSTSHELDQTIPVEASEHRAPEELHTEQHSTDGSRLP